MLVLNLGKVHKLFTSGFCFCLLIMPEYWWLVSRWRGIYWYRYFILLVYLLFQLDRYVMNLPDLQVLSCYSGYYWALICRSSIFWWLVWNDFLNSVHWVYAKHWFYFWVRYRNTFWDRFHYGIRICTDFIRWIAHLCSSGVAVRLLLSMPIQQDSADQRYVHCRFVGRRCILRMFDRYYAIFVGILLRIFWGWVLNWLEYLIRAWWRFFLTQFVHRQRWWSDILWVIYRWDGLLDIRYRDRLARCFSWRYSRNWNFWRCVHRILILLFFVDVRRCRSWRIHFWFSVSGRVWYVWRLWFCCSWIKLLKTLLLLSQITYFTIRLLLWILLG